MKLIVVLISLAMLSYWHLGRSPKRYDWFQSYVSYINKHLGVIGSPWIRTVLLLLPITAVILLIQLGFVHGIFYVLEFFFAIAILWYCLWPISLREYLESALAKQTAANDPADGEHNDDDAKVLRSADCRAMVEAMLCHANQRTFAVIFWFIILGPFGAMLYRAVTQLTKLSSKPNDSLNAIARCAHTLEDILDWLPARVLALSYALAGNFSKGFSEWLHNAKGGLQSNQDLLISTGVAAMDFDPDGESDQEDARVVLRMIERSLIVWIVVIAIFTLGAWVY